MHEERIVVQRQLKEQDDLCRQTQKMLQKGAQIDTYEKLTRC